jgi:serine/threonine protein kinase
MGSYVLLGRLGAGAMGRVYLARSAAGRLVAVKTIRPEYAAESDFRARFAREVAAARRVSGVFTAAVVAADPDAEVPWLATAYVPAPALDHLVQTCGPLPVPAVRWLAAGCAEALESIHEAGLVHRDLKPSNVLVAPDGPRVIDFGVARAVERISLTTTHGSVGTPAYMAPEQARDTSKAIVASDVFSLGSTLLFAASGHAPYQGDTVMDVLVRLATEPPDLDGLPTELTGIVVGCLQRDPRGRPTPAELLADLAPHLDSAGGHEFGRSALPAAAVALIEEYRQRPEPPVRVTDSTDGEATFGSRSGGPQSGGSRSGGSQSGGSQSGGSQSSVRGPHPIPVPVGGAPAPRRSTSRRGPGGVAARAGSSLSRAWRGGRIASVVVAVGAVAALVILGGLVGAWINGGTGSPPAQGGTGYGPPGGGPQPGGDPRPPLSGATDRPTGSPQIELNQSSGDRNTVFVVHGRGWVPSSQVTVRIDGRPASPVLPVVDLRGTFNYAINQQHEFFSGPIPLGGYTVLATAPGGRNAQATFVVGR